MDILTREANNIVNAEGAVVARFEANNIILEDGAGGGGYNYSTEEKKVGKWIDGRDIMQKTVFVPELPINNAITIDTVNGIVINVEGFAQSKDDEHQVRLIPFPAGGANDIRIDQSGNNVRLMTFADWHYYKAHITYRYIVEE